MPNSGAFRSLHCLIYKVLAPSAQRRNIYYLSTTFSVCQVLFSTFFEVVFYLAAFRFAEKLSDYIRPFLACQALFSSFQKFFQRRLTEARPLTDSLLTITDHSPFVNTFFPDFAKYFLLRKKQAGIYRIRSASFFFFCDQIIQPIRFGNSPAALALSCFCGIVQSDAALVLSARELETVTPLDGSRAASFLFLCCYNCPHRTPWRLWKRSDRCGQIFYSDSFEKQKKRQSFDCRFVLALPIFPGRLQPSIVGRIELNFRVRDGNGWTLDLINTNYSIDTPWKLNKV